MIEVEGVEVEDEIGVEVRSSVASGSLEIQKSDYLHRNCRRYIGIHT